MTRRGRAGRRSAQLLAPAFALACASTTAPSPAPAPAKPASQTASVADDHGDAPIAEELDPELLDLLTAHRREPPAEADTEAAAQADEAATRCHPERPDTPRERSLCICERVCARTIDRERLARQMLEAGGDPEKTQRWLDERRPSTLHYPLVEIDGTRIDFDGDGVVTRCRHYSINVPDSAVDIQCDARVRERADAAQADHP